MAGAPFCLSGACQEERPILRTQSIPATDRPVVPATSAEDLYDAALESAVRGFQQRHGLKADGVIGAGTRVIDVPKKRRKPAGYIEIEGAKQHNLKKVNAKIPCFFKLVS